MTMLNPTNRMIARKRIRSDLSFLAISAYKAPLTITRHTVSGQQSSVGRGRRHQLRRPGQPAFPAASPTPQRPTDDCSQLTACQMTPELELGPTLFRRDNRATSSLNLRPRSA